MERHKPNLADCLKAGDLEPFIAWAEENGIGPADRAEFDSVVERVTAPQPECRTSHSRGGGSKPEK